MRTMKKMRMVMICLMTIFCQMSVAQTIQEPEKNGEIYVITGDSFETLPKETGSFKTSAGLTSLIPSAALKVVKSYIKIGGAHAKVRYNPAAGEPVKFIVRVDDVENPEEYINLIKLDEKKKERRILMAKSSLLGGTESATWETVPFECEKYGEYSYLITTQLEAGEYAFMLSELQEEGNINMQFRCIGID